MPLSSAPRPATLAGVGDPIQASKRRVLVKGALLLAPVVAMSAAAPWFVERLSPGRRGEAAALVDRPPTDEEIRASRKADERLAKAEEGWRRTTAIAPAEAAPDAAGERVRWFPGFGVSVESNPPGATVLVNGRDMGETPLTASVECAPGEPVQVEVRMDGHPSRRRSTHCRRDQLVELSVELREPGAPPPDAHCRGSRACRAGGGRRRRPGGREGPRARR